MTIRVAYLLLVLTAVRAADEPPPTWPASDLFHPEDMKAFFYQQKNKVEKDFTSGYEEAVKMKDSVNSYFNEQQRRFSDDLRSYVDNVKMNSQKVADSFSFVPGEDNESRLENPDVVLSVPAIISRNGYVCETHTVVSQGYVLNVHRIPRSKYSQTLPTKTVYLQHGLFASSADWIINGPEKGLAYVLADAGYDVWMGNIRGNRYSKEHLFLKNKSKHYWNFSWHDVAQHDVPAIIDYIRNINPDMKITYIGHSMGTTILFAMLSLRPEYNEILSSGIALAPVVYMSDIKSPLKSLAPVARHAASMEMLYGNYEFMPKDSSLGRMTTSCQVDRLDSKLCKSIIFYICGANENQFNKTLLPVFLSHLGTGTSWKTALHFAQEVESGGKFQQFDYGTYRNNIIYGSDTPPQYDLSKVTLPISLFWARNDLLSGEKDVKLLYESLPSTTELYEVPHPEFNHLDYLWAMDANNLVNNKVLSSLERTHSHKDLFRINVKFFK